MPEVINVSTYGAVGNNRTAVTVACQNALNEAASAYNRNGNGKVPSGGTCLVGLLTQRGNTTFTGDGWGSRLRCKPNSDGYLLTLVDMSVDCSGGQQSAGGGLNFRYAVRCVVDHLEVMSRWQAGLMNGASPDGKVAFENTVTNCLYLLGKDSANAKGGSLNNSSLAKGAIETSGQGNIRVGNRT